MIVSGSIKVRCVGCKTKRDLTLSEAANGQPFCPKCGSPEVAISATVKVPDVKKLFKQNGRD